MGCKAQDYQNLWPWENPPSCLDRRISLKIRRQSRLQNGIVSFTCNEVPGGIPKQKDVPVLTNFLFVMVEGEGSYELQKLLRGFNCVIWQARSRT